MMRMSKDHKFDFTKATMYLAEGASVFLDIGPVDQSIRHLKEVEKAYLQQLRENMFSTFKYVPAGISKYTLFKFLEEAGVPTKYWKSTKNVSGESFDKNRQQKMVDDKELADWADLYRAYQKQKKYNDTVGAMMNRIRYLPKIEAADGSMITEVGYNLTPDYNRRFNTNKENVIGLYGNLRNSLKVPAGFVMVGSDFPQIDGKAALNTYFKTEEMLNIDECTEDSYLVFRELARQIHHHHDKHLYEKSVEGSERAQELLRRISLHDSNVQEFPDKAVRDIYKVIALKTVYNSPQSDFKNAASEHQFLKAALDVSSRYLIIKHYIKFLREIGYPVVVKSKFGYSRPITDEREFDALAKIFNSPIQATSSEIILNFISHILDQFREKGYTKDDVRLYVNRHDEPIFMIKEDLLVKYMHIFKNASHILIDGWKPFEMTWSFGYSYGENLDRFQAIYDAIPYDKTEIETLGRKHRKDSEPLPLEMPDIVAFNYRELPNGETYLVFSRYVGEIPMDGYHFEGYKDPRKIEYVLKQLTEPIEGSKEKITQYCHLLLQGIETTDEVIITLDEPDFGSERIILDDKEYFLTGKQTQLNKVNTAIMAAVVSRKYKEILTSTELNSGPLLEKYKPRLERRAVN